MTTEQPERERMTDEQIDHVLLAASVDGSGCKCFARSSGECACEAVWFSDEKHRAVHAITQLQADLAAERERAEKAETYKIALEDAAVCDWIEDKHWSDPKHLIAAIIDFNQKIALDPAVSKEARELRDTYLERLTLAEQQRDAAVEGLWKPASEHSDEFEDGDAYLVRIPVIDHRHNREYMEYYIIRASCDSETPLTWNDQHGDHWCEWDWEDVEAYIKLNTLTRIREMGEREVK